MWRSTAWQRWRRPTKSRFPSGSPLGYPVWFPPPVGPWSILSSRLRFLPGSFPGFPPPGFLPPLGLPMGPSPDGHALARCPGAPSWSSFLISPPDPSPGSLVLIPAPGSSWLPPMAYVCSSQVPPLVPPMVSHYGSPRMAPSLAPAFAPARGPPPFAPPIDSAPLGLRTGFHP